MCDRESDRQTDRQTDTLIAVLRRVRPSAGGEIIRNLEKKLAENRLALYSVYRVGRNASVKRRRRLLHHDELTKLTRRID